MWLNSTTQNVKKLKKKKKYCDKTRMQKLQLNSYVDETLFVMKHKLWYNTKCDETQIVMKQRMWLNKHCDGEKKRQRSKCEGGNFLLTALTLWPNSH